MGDLDKYFLVLISLFSYSNTVFESFLFSNMGKEIVNFPRYQPLFHHCSPSHQSSSHSSRKAQMEVALQVKKIKKCSECGNLNKSISVHSHSLLQKQERGRIWSTFYSQLQLWLQLQARAAPRESTCTGQTAEEVSF